VAPSDSNDLRRVVEKTLFYDLVAVPALVSKLFNSESFAVEPSEIKHPMNSNAITNYCIKIDRVREHIRMSRQRCALVCSEHVAAHARWMMVLLHRRVRRVEALNGLHMLTADDGGYEGLYGGLGWQGVRLIHNKLGIIANP
jgi:hypothetical protein